MAYRELQDPQGTTWKIWDVIPMGVTNERFTNGAPAVRKHYAQGWLTFECPEERRRLSPCPKDWHTLNDDELLALCKSAEVAGKPRRLIE
ncbi:MAG: hypothetical protein JWO05_3707 [Gemmatimonadetes bacterium]|nr:hypothetical protein [Gemmatimonadota bacterium]